MFRIKWHTKDRELDLDKWLEGECWTISTSSSSVGLYCLDNFDFLLLNEEFLDELDLILFKLLCWLFWQWLLEELTKVLKSWLLFNSGWEDAGTHCAHIQISKKYKQERKATY